MDLGIEGRVAIVTGASRGIGLATTKALLAERARVLIVARDEAALQDATSALAGDVAIYPADVAAPDAGTRIVAACTQSLGAPEIVVNNAGTSRAVPLEELTDAEWQQQWELNVMASMRLMRAAAPAMAERGWGRIVNVSSSSGKRPSLSNAAYTVAKSAQLMLSRVFADEYAGKGVLINAVAPGPVETGLWMDDGGLADQAAERSGSTRDEVLAGMRARIPVGRLGREQEIAAVITFLCSEPASNVAGSSWSVDGGIVPTFL
jgi:3-oxoacyl-[acyl-carrier protein] reductase